MSADVPHLPPAACLYAEFLPRLGRISVVTHLSTPSKLETKALVSDDGSRFLLFHDSVTIALRLPAKCRRAGELLSGAVKPGLFRLFWRLLPAEGDNILGKKRAACSDAVPWTASALKSGMPICCRACDAVVVGGNTIQQFKDLPSENWTEMMEFWHCHKPNNGSSMDAAANGRSGDELANRGYGANSAIIAQRGIGLVDIMTILFSEQDCNCLLMHSHDPACKPNLSKGCGDYHSLNVHCPDCRTQLGCLDLRKDGLSLFKWKIKFYEHTERSRAFNSEKTSLPCPPTLSHCLAAALVGIQARSGNAKAALHGENEVVYVWILNPEIKFSCLMREDVYAMKVLYQAKAVGQGVEEEGRGEEILLPDQVVREFEKVLELGNDFLPPGEKMRDFEDQQGLWKVSLLERDS